MPRFVVCSSIGLAVLGLAAAIAAGGLVTNPADQRLAARAQIRLADLPPGWRITATKPDDRDGPTSCLSKAVATATGESLREFAWRDVGTAAGRVGVFRTSRVARHVFSVGVAQKNWDCLTAYTKRLDGVTATWQSRVRLQSIGAPSVGREMVARVEQDGVAVLIGVHMDVAQKKRAVVIFVHVSVGAPLFSLAEESLVLRRMVARLP